MLAPADWELVEVGNTLLLQPAGDPPSPEPPVITGIFPSMGTLRVTALPGHEYMPQTREDLLDPPDPEDGWTNPSASWTAWDEGDELDRPLPMESADLRFFRVRVRLIE